VIAHFVDFNSSSLDVRIICQILFADWREYTARKETLLLEIMDIVEDLGISFAFPSRSIYIEDMPGAARPEQEPSIDEGQLPGGDLGGSPLPDQENPDSSPSSAP